MSATWKSVYGGVVAILAILMIVLIAQNTAPVETRLVFMTVTMPRAALLLVTLLVGVVLGIAVASRILAVKPTPTPQPGPQAEVAPAGPDLH